MILKDAFKHQKDLDSIIICARAYLNTPANITEIKQEHLRKATNPDAENEIVIVPKLTVFKDTQITPTTVIKLLMDVCNEKEKLTVAISNAKKSAPFDMDAAIAMNKVKQNLATTYNSISNTRTGERKTTGIGMKFNINNEQVSYKYDVVETTTIDFDRNLAKSLAKKLTKESDEISTKIDMLNITLEVDYTPKYDADDSFEDHLLKFVTV